MFGLLFPQLFAGAAQRRLFRRGLPVFTYHGVAQPPALARDPFLYVTPKRFDEQLAVLRQHGFTSGSLDDFPTPDNDSNSKVVITFDDGYVNVLKNAVEILARHQFKAIQFIVGGLIGKHNEWDARHGEVVEPLMDTAQIRDWLAAGHEIGSHSLTHRNLAKLNAADAREQIFDSKKMLEDLFGLPVRHFCYPHGKWTPMTRDLVGEAGYATACTTEFGVNTTTTPRFELNRVFSLSTGEFAGKVMHRIKRR